MTTLADTCRISTGKLDANAAVIGGNYPFFTCAETPSRIDDYAYDGSVVLVAGNNAQGRFHVSRYDGKFNAYQRTYILEPRPGFERDYLYYSLKLALTGLRDSAQGSQTKFLTMPILTGLAVAKRSLTEQRRAVAILSAIDAKVELNNRINAELEALAKTIYDYWFVQFDFPDAHGRPYRSSGGAMVWNDTLKREIPVGWEVGRLGKWIEFQRGISYRASDIGDEGTPLINLNSFQLDGRVKLDGTKRFSGKFSDDRRVAPGNLVVAITDVTRNADITGRAFVVPDTFGESPLISCDVAAVRSTSCLSAYYLEKLFNSDYYHRYLQPFAAGTLVLHLNLDGIRWFKTFLPPKPLVDKYDKIASSVHEKVTVNLLQNRELTRLRDWLLPLLMNGQVRVAGDAPQAGKSAGAIESV